jgi:topoisomerase IA-like protein
MHDKDGLLTKWIKDKDYQEYNEEYTFKLLSDQDIEKKESKSKKKKNKKKKKKKKNLFED